MRMPGLMAAAAVASLGYGAGAASPPSPERCDALDKQWRAELPRHLEAEELQTAKSLHAEGFALCLAGKTTEGVLKLEEALHDLGVQPEI